MQNKLAAKGRKMVTIIDPHIKRDGNYHIHKVGGYRQRWRWVGSYNEVRQKEDIFFTFVIEEGPLCAGAEFLFLVVYNFKAVVATGLKLRQSCYSIIALC